MAPIARLAVEEIVANLERRRAFLTSVADFLRSRGDGRRRSE